MLLAPTGAASFSLEAERTIERALQPGSTAVFEMPISIERSGAIYAKIIPTEGNAVHDGFRANGSIAEGRGWRVAFAITREDGSREELGQFVDSTPTALIPVTAGARPTLVMTVEIPADAAVGGPRQTIYVAIAFRVENAQGASGASGAQMDEARALTLLMTNDLLPPAAAPDSSPDVPVDEPSPQRRGDRSPPGAAHPPEHERAGPRERPGPAHVVPRGRPVRGRRDRHALAVIALTLRRIQADVRRNAAAARGVPVVVNVRDPDAEDDGLPVAAARAQE